MADKTPPDDHATRVHESFDALDAMVGDRLDDASRSAMERLRTAANAKDGDALRKQLTELRESHGWLYKELASHPQVATLLDELALLGF
jgi:Tfp pilus assembly protein PilO